MAGLASSNDVTVSMKKASAWGTAVAVSSGLKLFCSSLTPGGGFEESVSPDYGLAKKPTDLQRGSGSFNLGLTCALTFNQPWLALVASVMGTEASPVETTGGQSDYRHDIDMSDSISGSSKQIWSLGWTVEDATKIIEVPSFKPYEFTIEATVNQGGSVTINGLCDRFKIASQTSTYANVTSNTASAYSRAMFTGLNAYCRMNAQSGGALSGSNNLPVDNFRLTVRRGLRPQHVLQGADSPYIVEPKDVDAIEATLTIRLREIDSSVLDSLAHWESQTEQKAEIFMDGAIIGAGVNRSLKFQLPRLMPDPAFPGGYGFQNNSSIMQPEITFRMLKATAAPTGMTGVTELLRIVGIDLRSTKWTA